MVTFLHHLEQVYGTKPSSKKRHLLQYLIEGREMVSADGLVP